jgi:hypothetical protein
MAQSRPLILCKSVHNGNTAKVAEAMAGELGAEIACGGYDTWGPLWLAGGLNKKHPDGLDLERARKFAAGMAHRLSVAEAAATCAHCG